MLSRPPERDYLFEAGLGFSRGTDNGMEDEGVVRGRHGLRSLISTGTRTTE